MITAQIESLTEHLDELRPLFPLHYAELALDKDEAPLDPQYGIYLQRDALGEVILCTVRKDADLIGYFVGFIAPGLHYRTCLTCTMDIFYIHPEHRGDNCGLLLFETVQAELVRRGVKRWFVGTKIHFDCGWLFTKMGFHEIERYYSKVMEK